jgi:hypothetical protein
MDSGPAVARSPVLVVEKPRCTPNVLSRKRGAVFHENDDQNPFVSDDDYHPA